tara:strand:- start:852 stop:1853 length:1002 start_codon:yes stop_codon:yes gene_type:complete
LNKRNHHKKAIVTGGAGFIGSHMVDLLISKGFIVIVIDNLVGGHKKNLAHHKKNKRLILKKIDINKINTEDKIFNNTKYIFHFAGLGDLIPSIENPEKYTKINTFGTIKMLELGRKLNVKKFVYAASASCYGKKSKKVSENTKINLEHPYALSKYLGEQAALNWNKVYGLPVNSLRIFNAYGPRVRTTGAYGAVIGVFFKQKLSNNPLTIVGDGNQTRDFIHVKDVVSGFFLAAKTKLSGKVFNLGSAIPTKINLLANIIGGSKIFIPNRPGEPRHSYADNRFIKSKLNWKPKINFKIGITEMLKDINKWKKAPLWTKQNIKLATKDWFKYLN